MTDAQQNCAACKFYEPTKIGSGECRRNAPTAVSMNREERGPPETDWPTHWANWPTVIDDDWCGEFKRSEYA